ncbi:hypothetical protein AB8Z38_28960 [Bradyrhizobium sp. LLZ17]|uniref:Transposase n=1 Tax=Bradyrhizobium sp. LLZ17 TaxID=3239388 RepID=A0AB39XF16_9BRAD
MSDDDKLDFSQIYPEAGRNRKRFAANDSFASLVQETRQHYRTELA